MSRLNVAVSGAMVAIVTTVETGHAFAHPPAVSSGRVRTSVPTRRLRVSPGRQRAGRGVSGRRGWIAGTAAAAHGDLPAQLGWECDVLVMDYAGVA